MSIGNIGMKHPSLGGMVAAIKSPISRVALHYRFSKEAAAFLFKCLQYILKQKINKIGGIDTKLLRPFRRVLLIDSSGWDVNKKLVNIFPGVGGSASTANCKLQTAYDYKRGELTFFDMTEGTCPDGRYTDKLPSILKKNDLLLIDQGYFKLTMFAAIIDKGAFFLTRLFVGTTLRDATTNQKIDLEKHMRKVEGNACEIDIVMGGKRRQKVACRLVVLRVSDKLANERRRKMKQTSKRKKRTVSKHHLRMCAWTLLITNVPQRWLPLEMARALYTVRWQVELIFKQFKSVLLIHKSDTSNENRLRCELYGKLIGAVLIHRIHASETNRLWNTKHREVSMDKFYKRFQERTFTLLQLLITSFSDAVKYLRVQIKRIIPDCLKERQRTRMTTLEALEAQLDPMLETKGATVQ